MDTTGLDELTRLLHDEQAVTAQLMTFLQVGEGRGWLTQNAQAGQLEVAVDDLRGAERSTTAHAPTGARKRTAERDG